MQFVYQGIFGTMGKRLKQTPNSQIRSVFRQLFLRSRERGEAIKRDKYTCQKCGAKQSRAKGRIVKVEVHHKHGILNWDALFAAVRAYLLSDPDTMETLCVDCHKNDSKEGK